MTADGFIPGEDIATAPILVHARAGADGYAPAIELAETFVAGEVIVFGRVSGTIHIVTRD